MGIVIFLLLLFTHYIVFQIGESDTKDAFHTDLILGDPIEIKHIKTVYVGVEINEYRRLVIVEAELDKELIPVEQVAEEAYQILGVVSYDAGTFTNPAVTSALSYFSDIANGTPRKVKILPFELVKSCGTPNVSMPVHYRDSSYKKVPFTACDHKLGSLWCTSNKHQVTCPDCKGKLIMELNK